MEVQARELIERQSERLDDYPEVKAKVAAHLQETNHYGFKNLARSWAFLFLEAPCGLKAERAGKAWSTGWVQPLERCTSVAPPSLAARFACSVRAIAKARL